MLSMAHPVRLMACIGLLGIFVIEDPFYCSDSPDTGQQALEYLDQERYDEALVAARRAIRQNPKDASLHVLAALAHLGREDVEEGFAALGEAVRLDPENLRIHAAVRHICMQERQYARARDIYEAVVRAHPSNGPAAAGLGWALMNLDEDDRALALLEQALEHGGDDLFAYIQLGRLHLRGQRLEDAARALEGALRLEPEDPQLLMTLGECQLELGLAPQAEETFRKAVEGSPVKARAASRVAQTYYDQGRRHQAIHYYEQAVEYGPAEPLILNNLAWAYGEERIQLDRALELSLRAVKADGENVVYLDTYAELLYLTGDHPRALALIRRAVELAPEDSEHYGYLREQLEKISRAASP